MKKFTACVLCLFAFVQTIAQPISNQIKDVSLPSPTASSLGKYGEIPVGYYTGVPDIDIPIHTVTDGPLSLPISLNYHASGMKVAETASWVGLGWSLRAGGTISRTVQGKADESCDGYFMSGKHIFVSKVNVIDMNDANKKDTLLCLEPTAPYNLTGLQNGTVDSEPDLFSFSIGGYSGKFFIEADLTNDNIVNGKVMLIPKQDIKISYETSGSCGTFQLRKFTLITPDGTRYEFGNIDNDANQKGLEVQRFNEIPFPIVTGWQLRKIASPDGNYAIHLDYAPEKYRYPYRASGNGVFLPTASPTYPVSTPSGSYMHHVIDILGWRLSSITTAGNISTVSFLTAAEAREDLSASPWSVGNNPDPAKALSSIKIETGTLCKRFDLAQSYYVDASADISGTSGDKRLKLNGLQETSCDNSVQARPYAFQYHEKSGNTTFLPNRLSASTDHWGFYNGATNPHAGLNIPVTKLSPYAVGMETVYPIKGTGNRETSEAEMKLGTISKISYPTGGSTMFEFEANTFYGAKESATYTKVAELKRPTGGDVCINDVNPVQTVNFAAMTAPEIQNLYYSWINQAPPLMPVTCQQGAPNIVVILYVNGSNQPIFTVASSVSNVPGSMKSAEGKLADLFKNKIPANLPFALKIQGINITSNFTINKLTINTSTQNHIVGGLRIKKITSSNGTAAGPDIIKSYVYEKAVMPGQSSGLLYHKPVYGHVFQSCLGGCTFKDTTKVICPDPKSYYQMHFFFETSVVPLSSLEGYHIGYSAVREYFDGSTNGYYNLYQYYNEPESPFLGLPVTPSQPRISSGSLESKAQRTSNDADIAYEILDQKPEASTLGLGNYVKWNTYFAGGDPNGNPITFWKKYPIATRPFRYQSVTNFRDGQTTNVAKQYAGTNHLQVTKESLTNSDGKVTDTEYKYPPDLAASLPAAQVSKFTELNILVSLETTVKVGGATLRGAKTEYAFFDNVTGSFASSSASSPSNFIRPYKFHNYEVTYNAAAVLQAGAWVQKGVIDNYHGTGSATGRAGLPKQFSKTGWLPETYEWYANGMIKKRKFKDFAWSYEYLDGKNLVSKVTNPDGQFSEFTYDKLMRLKETKARNNNVKTLCEYNNPVVNGAGVITTFGHVKTTNVFTAVPGSGLGTQEVFQYFDGLGRSIETVFKGKANAKDQVQAVAYDNQGRVSKTFEVYASGTATGEYVNTAPNADHSLTEYEANSLNRITKQTPAAWASTTTNYGTNAAGDAVINYNFTNGSTSNFGAGSLTKTTVTDGNGNKSTTFHDKKGRMLLSRRSDNGANSKSDTYYVYDDKDRLVKVIPPGATWGSTNLNFEYQYLANDRVAQKKIPGKAPELYEYNSRDLPVRFQDAFLANNASRWMGSTYDDYGRLTAKGVYASGSGDGIVLSNKIIENIYGNAGVEIDKLKTSKTMVFGAASDPVAKLGSGLGTLQKTFAYDSYGRFSGYIGNNHTSLGNNAAESTTYGYDFGDNILFETRNSTHAASNISITNSRLYDGWGRLTQTSQSINGAAATTISRLSYTNKDQLAWKKLGSGANGLQQVDYDYNQSGMLKSINGTSELTNSSFETSNMLLNLNLPTFNAATTEDLFRLSLEYATLTPNLNGTVQSSGNIGQMLWQVKGRTTQAYGFAYDYLDRLTNAKYTSYKPNASPDPIDYFGESQTYDARGNILSITRKGMVPGAGKFTNTIIDNQVFTIPAASNHVSQSIGPSSIPSSHINLDAPHNYLNLPSKFDFGTNNLIELWYDGLGNKLRKIVKTNNAVTLTQDYLEGIELKNNAIEAVYNQEGRAFNNAGTFRYEYVLKDHLGNTRLTFTDKNNNGIINSEAEILQENHYYPFGKPMSGSWYKDGTASKYRYLYNGKELHEEFNLNFYDFGARWLDPGVGSWWEVDPLAENGRRWSPYVYGNNNPIRFVDPDGMLSVHLNEVGTVLGYYNDGDHSVYLHEGAKSSNDYKKEYHNKTKTSANGEKIGELGAQINIDKIYSNILDENAAEAEGMGLIEYHNKVKNGAEWDYKNRTNSIFGLVNRLGGNTNFVFEGNKMEAQDVGNHHYGVVGRAAGFEERFLLEQAGLAQIIGGTSSPEWQNYRWTTVPGSGVSMPSVVPRPPYGDDPRDQRFIRSGFNYFNRQNRGR